MSTDKELPEIQVTRGEKLLAAVLAIFLLIGGLWVYFEPLPREDPYASGDVPETVATRESGRRSTPASGRTTRSAARAGA